MHSLSYSDTFHPVRLQQILEDMFPNTIISPSELVTYGGAAMTDTQSSLTYQLNSSGTGSNDQSQNILSSNDAFLVTGFGGFFAVAANVAALPGAVRQTYPNAVALIDAAVVASAESFYNGFGQIVLNTTAITPKMSLRALRYVPETQQTAAVASVSAIIANSQNDASRGYQKLPSNIMLSGQVNSTVQYTWQNVASPDFTPTSAVLIWEAHLPGFLIVGGAQQAAKMGQAGPVKLF